MRLGDVHLVRARLHADQREQPHRRAEVEDDAGLARGHEHRDERADRLRVEVGAQGIEEGRELLPRREHRRVRDEVRADRLHHLRAGEPLLRRGEVPLDEAWVEEALAEGLALGVHGRVHAALRVLRALLHRIRLLGRQFVHPIRVVHALDVQDHLQHLARLDEAAGCLDVVGLQLADLCEDGGRLLPLFALLQRAPKPVEPLWPIRPEVAASAASCSASSKYSAMRVPPFCSPTEM